MIIECMNGRIVNADLIVKYEWCDVNGNSDEGYSGNNFLMGFYDDGEFVCLGVFHSSTDATRPDDCVRAWEKLQKALKDNVKFLLFK